MWKEQKITRRNQRSKGAKEVKAARRKNKTSKKYNYGMRNHRHKGRKEEKDRSKEQIKDNVQDKKERAKKINNVLDIKCRLVISK